MNAAALGVQELTLPEMVDIDGGEPISLLTAGAIILGGMAVGALIHYCVSRC